MDLFKKLFKRDEYYLVHNILAREDFAVVDMTYDIAKDCYTDKHLVSYDSKSGIHMNVETMPKPIMKDNGYFDTFTFGTSKIYTKKTYGNGDKVEFDVILPNGYDSSIDVTCLDVMPMIRSSFETVKLFEYQNDQYEYNKYEYIRKGLKKLKKLKKRTLHITIKFGDKNITTMFNDDVVSVRDYINHHSYYIMIHNCVAEKNARRRECTYKTKPLIITSYKHSKLKK